MKKNQEKISGRVKIVAGTIYDETNGISPHLEK